MRIGRVTRVEPFEQIREKWKGEGRRDVENSKGNVSQKTRGREVV